MAQVDFTAQGVPVYHWPRLLKPSEITLHLRFNTASFTSPYTGNSQTQALPGALHQLEAGFPSVPKERLGEFRAFLASLQGGAGRFIFPAIACRYAPPALYAAERITLLPLTADDAYITADDTHITADATVVPMESVFTVSTCPDAHTIVGTLWLNSRRAPLEVGSPISWDDADGWRHLHTVTELERDGTSGATTLTVQPPMRALPTPATPMHVHAPSGIFRLADDGQAALRQAGRQTSFSIAAVQAFPITVTV
jgi:hypothetical protein